jgi:hypothetical protein
MSGICYEHCAGMLTDNKGLRMTAQRMFAILTLATALTPYSVRADVDIELIGQACSVIIRGEITMADADKLESSNCPRPMIALDNSPGGDVRAGMRIGRWIRENQAATVVARNDKYCYSTCALVFIAGVDRINIGVIGLHRPYLTGTPQSAERIPALVSAMREDVKAYIAEVPGQNSRA